MEILNDLFRQVVLTSDEHEAQDLVAEIMMQPDFSVETFIQLMNDSTHDIGANWRQENIGLRYLWERISFVDELEIYYRVLSKETPARQWELQLCGEKSLRLCPTSGEISKNLFGLLILVNAGLYSGVSSVFDLKRLKLLVVIIFREAVRDGSSLHHLLSTSNVI